MTRPVNRALLHLPKILRLIFDDIGNPIGFDEDGKIENDQTAKNIQLLREYNFFGTHVEPDI